MNNYKDKGFESVSPSIQSRPSHSNRGWWEERHQFISNPHPPPPLLPEALGKEGFFHNFGNEMTGPLTLCVVVVALYPGRWSTETQESSRPPYLIFSFFPFFIVAERTVMTAYLLGHCETSPLSRSRRPFPILHWENLVFYPFAINKLL